MARKGYGPVRKSRGKVTWVKPPKSAVSIAKKALKRQEGIAPSKRGGLTKGEAGRAGITSGIERAKSIARGDLQPAEDIRDFFNRFKGTYQDAILKGKSWENSKVQQAWDIWGGTPMWKAALKALEKADKKDGDGKMPVGFLRINPCLPCALLAGLNPAPADKIPGGLADGMSPSDFDPIALAKGIAHEMEHTSDPDIAREIAMDHLAERADYYDMLESLEAERVECNAIGLVEGVREGYEQNPKCEKKPFPEYLWDRAQAWADMTYAKHSAYKSMAKAKKFKELGGVYLDDCPGGTTEWLNEKWVDICTDDLKPCGRGKGEKRGGYPKCLPKAKAKKMTKAQRKDACKRKRAAEKRSKGQTYVSTMPGKKKKSVASLVRSALK